MRRYALPSVVRLGLVDFSVVFFVFDIRGDRLCDLFHAHVKFLESLALLMLVGTPRDPAALHIWDDRLVYEFLVAADTHRFQIVH